MTVKMFCYQFYFICLVRVHSLTCDNNILFCGSDNEI